MDPSLTSDEEIQALLEYNPPPVRVPPGSADGEQSLSFYDKHLSSNLGLKRIVYLPTLLQDLSKAMDCCLDFADVQEIDLPPVTYGDDFRTKYQREAVSVETESIDASSIARLYAKTTGENCEAVSSVLFLTPRCSLWLPAFGFTRNYMVDNPVDQAFTVEEYSICLRTKDKDIRLYPEVMGCLTDDKLQLLRRLFKRDRRLATWEFLPYTTQAIEVIQNLCGAKPSSSKTTAPFKMCTYPPVGKFRSPAVPLPYDAEATPGRPHISRRSSRVRKPMISKAPPSHRPPTVHIPSQPSPGQSSTVDHVVQHAWVTACRRDSTFIIFQCGNYERIGIRDRASQTLYLSDIIDVPNSKTPSSYTELHINLYISILDDAMQRAAHLDQPENPPIQLRKRQLDADEPSGRPRQRRKIRSHSSRLRHAAVTVALRILDILNDVRQRQLLLLSIQYGVYSSPNPATFFRCGHRPNFTGAKRAAFKPNEYVQLKLTSLITRGATGTAHEGMLEVHHGDRELTTCSVVAKLAFGDAQRERMKHEAIIYEHLTEAGVRGIPKYYGIFEDLHDGPLVLVTSHEGFWLYHWVPESSGNKVPMLWRKRFLLAMKEIHNAGVCHRDIRPENLLVNADGAVCIIDFDKADLTSSVGARKREYVHLENLVAGIYTPPGSFPSPKTASSGSGLSLSPIHGSD